VRIRHDHGELGLAGGGTRVAPVPGLGRSGDLWLGRGVLQANKVKTLPSLSSLSFLAQVTLVQRR